MPSVTGQVKATRQVSPLAVSFGRVFFMRKGRDFVDRNGRKARVRTLVELANERSSREAAPAK